MSAPKMTPIDQAQVQKTAQVVYAFLGDENVSVPGNLVEGIMSGKSLLRAIVEGNLFVCAPVNMPDQDLKTVEAAPEETG